MVDSASSTNNTTLEDEIPKRRFAYHATEKRLSVTYMNIESNNQANETTSSQRSSVERRQLQSNTIATMDRPKTVSVTLFNPLTSMRLRTSTGSAGSYAMTNQVNPHTRMLTLAIL